MKKIKFILMILALTAPALWAQMPPGFPGGPGAGQNAPASETDTNMQEIIPPGMIDFEGVDVSQVLEVYAHLMGRTLLHGALPQASIVLKTETNLTKGDAIQALQAVLALNGIAVIDVPGGKFIKVVPTEQAGQVGEQFNNEEVSQLPEMGSYITRIVQLHYVKPSAMVAVISPFARNASGIIPIDDNGIIVLRDYTENVKRMMEMIQAVDVVVPAAYTNEVIPIKYAMVDDIANVLNSLETAGGGTVSFGQTTTPSSSAGSHNGFASTTGSGGYGGSTGVNGIQSQPGQSSFGQSPQGSTSSTPGSSPFANRLQSILNRVQNGGSGSGPGATGSGFGVQQPIQILGQAKIIADERANSLLIYASVQDMQTIKDIVAKLDVLLAQVLIESVIMEVDLNKQWSYGISAAQQQQNIGNASTIGAINNGTPFYSFIQNVTSNSWPGNFTQTAPSGLSYFANIGGNWDLALQAAASDSSTHIIQRPRIQTSQAKEASFFVGQSVPYVTSVYYDSGFNGGPSSSYSQLQVGISLDVTPFINPDGLVVMDINQQINDISGFQTIEGVGQVPTTDNRTFTSEVAVKDRDTIILGGFTDTETDKSSSGVPLLQDIPVLGWLFKSPSSTKTRQELLVLMRPTVLRSPQAAALQAVDEQVKSPGIIAARREEKSVINQESKAESTQLKYEEIHGEFDTNTLGNP